MNEEQLNKVFTAITKLEAKVDEGFARIEETKADKSDMDRIFNTLDYIVEKLDTDAAERAAQNAQLDRHEERMTKLEQLAA